MGRDEGSDEDVFMNTIDCERVQTACNEQCSIYISACSWDISADYLMGGTWKINVRRIA